jgi:hypothetical protein
MEVYKNGGSAEVMRVISGKYLGKGERKIPFKKYPDEFIHWLRFANAGMLHEGNIYSFSYALTRLPTNDPLLEIGTFCGLSTNVINYLLKKYGISNKFFTCDKWDVEDLKSEGFLGSSGVTASVYRQYLKDSYINNIKTFSPDSFPHTIECFSDTFFRKWEKQEEVTDVFGKTARLGGLFSFCYIDGNHSYKFVQRDFLNCDRFLAPGGFILFDDATDVTDNDINRVVDEVKTRRDYRIVLKNPNYLFQKRF